LFFKKTSSYEPKLAEVAPKVTQTGYLFWNINDDLGTAAEQIMKGPPHIRMAYGYARRAAVAAMYVQGLVDKDTHSHVSSIFKALQHQTEQSIEFQEKAGAESISFMQSYHYLISSMFVRKVISIAQDYEIPPRRLSDAELFAEVADTLYAEQQRSQEN
jgi:hypothetical protein